MYGKRLSVLRALGDHGFFNLIVADRFINLPLLGINITFKRISHFLAGQTAESITHVKDMIIRIKEVRISSCW